MELRQGLTSNGLFGIASMASLRAMPCSTAVLAVLAVNFLFADGHDGQRVVEVIFLIGFALWCAATQMLRAALSVAPPLRWPLSVLLAIGCMSASLALVPRFAFYEVASLALLVLLALAIAVEIAPDAANNIMFLCQGIGLVCLLYALRILLAYVSAFFLGTPADALSLTPGFSNHRFFNHAQTVTLPFLVLLALLSPSTSRMRWLWFFLAASWWAMVYVTAARGTLLGVLAGCAAVLALRWRQSFPYLRLMIATALAGAVIYAILFVLLPALAGLPQFGEFSRVVERTAADPGSGRWPLWATAFALALEHPWLGVGPLHFAHYGIVAHNAAHPHDWALQVLAEWGIPAFAFLLLVIVKGGLGLLRTGQHLADTDRRNQDVLVAMLATGSAVLADGLVSGLIVMPQTQLLIALYLGCAIAWSRSMREVAPARPASSLPRAVAATVFMLALGVGVAAGVWPDIGARLRHEPFPAEQAAKGRPYVLWPRLWQDGFF